MSLAREFREHGVVRGRSLYLGAEETLAFIARARDERVTIFGIDGLWVTDSTTQPDMEHMLDLGSGGESCWADAEAFVRERASSGLMFDVTADEDTSDLLDATR